MKKFNVTNIVYKDQQITAKTKEEAIKKYIKSITWGINVEEVKE